MPILDGSGNTVVPKYHPPGIFAAGNYNPVVGTPKTTHHALPLVDALPFGLPNVPITSSGVKAWEFKGRGRITGTVKNSGAPDMPVFRRVRLYREPEGVLIKDTWSNPVTGAYEFTGIPTGQKYTVISYDHTGEYGAVVADSLPAELM